MCAGAAPAPRDPFGRTGGGTGHRAPNEPARLRTHSHRLPSPVRGGCLGCTACRRSLVLFAGAAIAAFSAGYSGGVTATTMRQRLTPDRLLHPSAPAPTWRWSDWVPLAHCSAPSWGSGWLRETPFVASAGMTLAVVWLALSPARTAKLTGAAADAGWCEHRPVRAASPTRSRRGVGSRGCPPPGSSASAAAPRRSRQRARRRPDIPVADRSAGRPDCRFR